MRTLARRWTATSPAILANAGSLVGTTAVTSGLGYLYWWLAARQFPPAAVGVAAAAISAMMLLGSIGRLGLGALLISELPRRPGKEGSLISTAVLLAGAAGAALGGLFALVAPALSTDFADLHASLGGTTLFALGVSLTAVTMVLDQALIGLLRGHVQLGRNALFAVAKLGALLAASAWLIERQSLTIYASWAAGNLCSLAGLTLLAARRGKRRATWRSWAPGWCMLRDLGRATLGHHALNLSLQAPALLLPVLVTALLSATATAYFYTAWMMASFAFVAPTALATALHAVGARAPTDMGREVRLTLRLGLLASALANLVLLVGADRLLAFFGAAYAEHAGWSLRILGLAAFPLIVKNHYVAVSRVHGRVAQAALLLAAGGLLEITLAFVGTGLGGLAGLSVGWLVAVCLEATASGGVVYRAARDHAAVGVARSQSGPEAACSGGRPGNDSQGGSRADGHLVRARQLVGREA